MELGVGHLANLSLTEGSGGSDAQICLSQNHVNSPNVTGSEKPSIVYSMKFELAVLLNRCKCETDRALR